MGFQKFDLTGNESHHSAFNKIRSMLQELYNGAASTFTSLTLGTGTKTAAATAGAAELNQPSGVITSESLTTAAGASYNLTIDNTAIAAGDVVLASIANGTNSQGTITLGRITPASQSVTIEVRNTHASQALNGTIKVSFVVFKA